MLTRAAVRAAREGEGRCGITWSLPRARSAHPSRSYPLVLHSCSPESPRPRLRVPLSWFSKHSSLRGRSQQPISPPRPRRLRRRAPGQRSITECITHAPATGAAGKCSSELGLALLQSLGVRACDTRRDERATRQKSGYLALTSGPRDHPLFTPTPSAFATQIGTQTALRTVIACLHNQPAFSIMVTQ